MTPAAPAQEYRVKSTDARVHFEGAPTFRITVEALDYGPAEDGPKVGQVLRLARPASEEKQD